MKNNNKTYKQYSEEIIDTYTENLLDEISNILKIPIDKNKLYKARDNKGEISKENLCIFVKPDDPKIFIFLDLRRNGISESITIRCNKKKSKQIKKIIKKYDKKGKKDISDLYLPWLLNELRKENNYLLGILEYNRVNLSFLEENGVELLNINGKKV